MIDPDSESHEENIKEYTNYNFKSLQDRKPEFEREVRRVFVNMQTKEQ